MAEQEKRAPAEGWLDKATAGIRFGPDRREVRRELEEHLEDKALDYLRIFPGLTQEEAQDRAAAEMGDPEEIGKELARLHKPLLGYAWLASKVLLGVVIGAGVLLFANRTYQSGLSNLLDGPHSWYGDSDPPIAAIYKGVELDYLGPLADSGPVQAGEYTFSTDCGELWNVTMSNGETSRVVYLQLEVRHPRPMEQLNYLVEETMWAQDDRGGVILSQRDYFDMVYPEQGGRKVLHFDRLDDGIFTDRYEVSIEIIDRSAQRVDLRYTEMGADLTIPISLEVTEP